VSASDCWAVGSYLDGSTNANGGLILGFQTLFEHWDGSSWSIVPSAHFNVTQPHGLSKVTCVATSDCWAVGGYLNDSGFAQALIEHWDGTSWTIVSSPNINTSRDNLLVSVTCVATSDCWAIGSSYGNDSGFTQTLVEHWDGNSWAKVTSPNVTGTGTGGPQNNYLSRVTCVSASDCWAVGYYLDGTKANGRPIIGDQTLVEHWDGSSWTIVSSANIFENQLLDVTCNLASDCWAVGSYDIKTVHQTLIEHWDGNSWTIVSSPNTSPTDDDQLVSVTCASTSQCWAVGRVSANNRQTTLIERWDGTSWTIVTSPNTDPSVFNVLEAVTCGSASDCWAVGFSADVNSYGGTLMQHWGANSNSWTIVPSPNVLLPQNNTLSGINCLSASDCWAVASYESSGTQQTFIEHWDGTSWAIVSSPNTSATQDNVLQSVACASTSDCWATGYYNNGTALRTLIERWDGTSWAIYGSSSNGSLSNSLAGATCTSASNCWAVGYYDNGSAYQTLIERWNGASWNVTASPDSDTTHENRLYGVTCTSASDCWAVGRYSDGTTLQTLTEHWDGSSWSIIASANTSATENNVLSGITCASTSNCWSVGSVTASGGGSRPLIEHWDGSLWSITSSSDIAGSLSSVTCISASDCRAVGSQIINSAQQTFIEQWDGSSWSVANSPNTSNQISSLAGVTCASDLDCWAVGSYLDDHGVTRTLTERYVVSTSLTPTSVVSRQTHGSGAPFDIDLTNGNGIECRSGGANGNYTLVFSFANTLTSVSSSSVTSGAGSIGSSNIDSNDAHNYIVNLTGVTNAQIVAVSLTNVTDSVGNFGSAISASMGVLLGDVNGSGRVDAADVSLVRQQTLQPVTTDNFRADVNVSGRIDAADVSITRQQTLTSLP
jgi:hypothetical protein